MLGRGDSPGSASCGCTTARSTAGTARSTTSSDGRPHLRVENRVLPAGPTVVDIVANAAFYYGCARAGPTADRPVWTRMSFSAAEENLTPAPVTASRRGCTGPGWGRSGPSSCCGAFCRSPTRDWTASASTRRIATGCSASSSAVAATRRNGASWQSGAFHRLYGERGLDRSEALRELTVRYRDHMHSNEPVHEWPLD